MYTPNYRPRARKTVIADEPFHVCAFRLTCRTSLRCVKTAIRSYNLHNFICILRNIPAQVTIRTISYVAIGITHSIIMSIIMIIYA